MESIYNYLFFISFLVIGGLAAVIVERSDKIRKIKESYQNLLNSFNDLDEQAKLIVKTDLELNRTQEELDKRLDGLDALQKISRLISTTLDENEIFQRLNHPLLSELGFEKYLIMLFDNNGNLQCRAGYGFSNEEIEHIPPLITRDNQLMKALEEQQIVSSLKTLKETKNNLSKVFNVKHYILTPILAQQNKMGIIIAGNQSDAYAVTEGDEELISILADQVGQAVKNARLFEEVYRSTQELELKIQDRTKQLTSALEEVQKISNTKSEFISAVSHELRTPLTSIKGYASLLITGKIGPIPENVRERLDKINKHSDNLVKLINDLLDIARIESGRVEMKFAPYSLSKIVENVQDLLTPQLKERNLQLAVNIPAELPDIQVDLTQFERVLINLIGNAIKFTPPDGRITVQAVSDDKKITISVADTGIGVAPGELDKLFMEFYRVENEINQNVKGTGLGLTLVKKIVEAHGGKIWATSKLNQGTTFYFTLPLELITKKD